MYFIPLNVCIIIFKHSMSATLWIFFFLDTFFNNDNNPHIIASLVLPIQIFKIFHQVHILYHIILNYIPKCFNMLHCEIKETLWKNYYIPKTLPIFLNLKMMINFHFTSQYGYKLWPLDYGWRYFRYFGIPVYRESVITIVT